MLIKIWGCRGSIAVSGSDMSTGGNTTCFEIKSECLPPGSKLMVDAGTGFVPAGHNYLSELNSGLLNYHILFTHYHWDHVLGLTLSPPTFIDSVPMTIYGPDDSEFGPKEVISYIFKRPFFPVDSARIRSKMTFKSMPDFDVYLIIVHPQGGFRLINRDLYTKMFSKGQISFKGGDQYSINECMVISMQPANHGNSKCISYRFHEMPSNKIAVICTDHEDEAGLAVDFKKHLQNANLLIADAQYNLEKYKAQTARFGHGTPACVVNTAIQCGVARVGITHHDPRSTDEFLDNVIMKEAKEQIKDGKVDVFLCKDYEEFEV